MEIKLNSKIRIIFDDPKKVTIKEGIYLGENRGFVFVKQGDTSPLELFPKNRIIRIIVLELMKGGEIT